MEKKNEIRIPWGSGIVGYVAQSGEPLNIPDAYKVKKKPFFFFLTLSCLVSSFRAVSCVYHLKEKERET